VSPAIRTAAALASRTAADFLIAANFRVEKGLVLRTQHTTGGV
jgi:hypothetical protein